MIYQVEQGFKLIPAIIMIALLLVYVGVGFISKVSTSSGYWVAGRSVGKFGNGAAIASDWMSAASFMGIAGLLYLKGAWGPTFLMGWTGGYLLLLTLVAAQISRFGKYTIPEFLATASTATASASPQPPSPSSSPSPTAPPSSRGSA